MTIPIDSLNIIEQLNQEDIIFQVDTDEMEKFKIDEINERQIVAVREGKVFHLKIFRFVFFWKRIGVWKKEISS